MFSAQINIGGSGIKSTRQFGITFGLVLLFWGWVLSRHNNMFGYNLTALGCIFLFLALLFPLLLAPLHTIFKVFGVFTGFIFTGVILTGFFFLVVTPIALLGRLFGKKFIQKDFNAKQPTYWKSQEVIEADKEYYKKQY